MLNSQIDYKAPSCIEKCQNRSEVALFILNRRY